MKQTIRIKAKAGFVAIEVTATVETGKMVVTGTAVRVRDEMASRLMLGIADIPGMGFGEKKLIPLSRVRQS